MPCGVHIAHRLGYNTRFRPKLTEKERKKDGKHTLIEVSQDQVPLSGEKRWFVVQVQPFRVFLGLSGPKVSSRYVEPLGADVYLAWIHRGRVRSSVFHSVGAAV